MAVTSKSQFEASFTDSVDVAPVFETLLLDRETPVTIYQRFPSRAYFLYESAATDGNSGRYSFVGLDRQWRLSAFRGSTSVEGIDIDTSGTPLDVVRRILNNFKCAPIAQLPDFLGGAVGYVTYDYVRNIERLPGHDHDPSWPDVEFSMPKILLIIDHLQHATHVVVLAKPDEYDKAVDLISEVKQQLIHSTIENDSSTEEKIIDAPNRQVDHDVRAYAMSISNFTREEYCETVRRAQEHIYLGDVFQVVPSQQFKSRTSVAPLTLYRVLRSLNPSPYMYLFDTGKNQIIGASPEMLVRVHNREVHTRPIAGTRRRGNTVSQDQAIEEELLSDRKEVSEHVMLVDLGRNDIGKVAAPGSVEVIELAHVERFSHLMHIVSNVRGTLRNDADAISAFNAVFPAGTLTGAPKIRAMELIDAFEPTYRGPYGGAIGYFSVTGSADFAITIRTVAISDGVATVQAGGGVVAASEPELEYQECITKASAPLLALLIAEH